MLFMSTFSCGIWLETSFFATSFLAKFVCNKGYRYIIKPFYSCKIQLILICFFLHIYIYIYIYLNRLFGSITSISCIYDSLGTESWLKC
jgi:hypothetical protein